MKNILAATKKSSTMLALAALTVLLMLSVVGYSDAASASPPLDNVKLRMSFKGGEVLISLYDTQAGRELVAMLPLTLTFEDYAQTEKIARLQEKLSSGVSPSSSPQGDFTYYAPWGNLAVFYKGYGTDSGLYILGRIESGKETLANLNRDFIATLELIN